MNSTVTPPAVSVSTGVAATAGELQKAASTGMVLITMRAADEVRPAEFPKAEGKLDPDMVAIATTIVQRRTGAFDPSTFQEALRELAEAKLSRAARFR